MRVWCYYGLTPLLCGTSYTLCMVARCAVTYLRGVSVLAHCTVCLVSMDCHLACVVLPILSHYIDSHGGSMC